MIRIGRGGDLDPEADSRRFSSVSECVNSLVNSVYRFLFLVFCLQKTQSGCAQTGGSFQCFSMRILSGSLILGVLSGGSVQGLPEPLYCQSSVSVWPLGLWAQILDSQSKGTSSFGGLAFSHHFWDSVWHSQSGLSRTSSPGMPIWGFIFGIISWELSLGAQCQNFLWESVKWITQGLILGHLDWGLVLTTNSLKINLRF